jgi:trimethylamine--corrinoid protein Co-methyltransferase
MPDTRLRLAFFSEAALDQIETTAFRLLAEVGILLQHAGATEMLHGLGCRVDQGRVHIPRAVVESSLKHLTRHRVFRSADGRRELTIGDGEIRVHNAGGLPFVFDLETGQRRSATLRDVADMARLTDALPNVDVAIPMCGAQDTPAELMTPASFEALLHNTRKPIHAAAAEKPADVYYLVKLAAACCGGEAAFRQAPTIPIMASPISPLTFGEQVTATILAIAQSGAPYYSLPAPTLGGAGPITLAGCLAQQHAEVLASFVLVAAAQPGAQVMYCSRIIPTDMRTAVSAFGGPEVGMASAGAAQLAHRLGLGCDAYGLCTNSARLDPQFAYERFANAMQAALAGVDILSGAGVMENNMAASYEAAVIDDEIIRLIKHITRGITVNEDALAFDVMRDTILGDGVFLSQMHTVRQMRRGVIWMPAISERALNTGEDPEAGVVARARRRAKEILATHQVEPLPDGVQRNLAEIMEEARRKLT